MIVARQKNWEQAVQMTTNLCMLEKDSLKTRLEKVALVVVSTDVFIWNDAKVGAVVMRVNTEIKITAPTDFFGAKTSFAFKGMRMHMHFSKEINAVIHSDIREIGNLKRPQK
ncbi:hypothetical protein PoB_002495800 [Plakobranchus ocellatus]|uniref:Uncharacterized protein n=1 Tax=Plakobranchus ocellatus TaxID=259542 RepID=A0AAV3ZVI8_9GAST|nr:hypothetical protein PoB_002495800 [Plakobranchus ocellatus]